MVSPLAQSTLVGLSGPANGETFPLLGLGLDVVWIGDLTQAQSEQFGRSESEDFAEGGASLGYPSIPVEHRHTIGCMLERISEKPLV